MKLKNKQKKNSKKIRLEEKKISTCYLKDLKKAQPNEYGVKMK